MCSSKILLLVCLYVRFYFFTAAHFHLAGRSLPAASISHLVTDAMKFSCFPSNKISPLCFQSLALAPSQLSK